MTPDPLELIDQAVRLARTITIRTTDGKELSGQPLHIGPNSVWVVVANTDVFVPLDAIVDVGTALNPISGQAAGA